MCKDDVPEQSVIGYLPVINASPTELSTVQTVLKQCIAKADALQQASAIVMFDQAIYAKSKEIVRRNPPEYQRVVVRMGAFHTACVFMAVIGQRFGTGGLSDILIESGLVS